jgi:hypothetical protein
MSSCDWLPAPEDAAAAEASSALEISMINLWSFFGNEKPWVPLASPCGAAPGLEAKAMSGLMFRRTVTRLPFDLQRGL